MTSQTIEPGVRQAGRRIPWVRSIAQLTGLLVVVAVLAAVVGPKLLGYQTYVIYGSSMEPAIEVGSMVVAASADPDELEVGDIIVFGSESNETTLTHRIISIREEGGQRYFRTKGDASNGQDPLEVDLKGGVQRVAFHIPYLGYFVSFAKSPVGILLLVALPAVGLLALILADGRRARKDQEAIGEA